MMKLSTIFELLLIFLIISFAATKYIDSKHESKWKSLIDKSFAKELRKERQTVPNRHCNCSNLTCNCCRDFSLPVVPVISGPGCASLKYLQGDSMLVTMSFGERVLRNVTISGKKPKPICMSLPGGESKFCGRIYGISREGENVRACLGLELRTNDDVEASLRVSCFKLGPKGLNVEPGKPLPTDEEDEDDEDDDDDFGFPGDEEDDEEEGGNAANDDDDDDVFGLGDDDDDESDNTVDSGESDYTGFSALSDEFLESFFESESNDKKKKPATTASKPLQQVAQVTQKPIVAATTPAAAVKRGAKPQRVVTNKSVVSSATAAAAAVQITTERIPNATADKVSGVRETYPSAATEKLTVSSVHKVYVSPSQYKPTEKIRPTPNQPLEMYIPSVAQLPTEKVYTSPQQLSTDRVYTVQQQQQGGNDNNNYMTTIDDKQQQIVNSNYYVPTTQQFLSTEKIYIPANLSTPETEDFEPVTSTSMTVNIMQNVVDDEQEKKNNSIVSSVTEVTPDNEYNEIDSDAKTTITETVVQSSTASSTIPAAKTRRPTTVAVPTSSPAKLDKNSNTEDEDSLDNIVDSAASIFEDEDDRKNVTNSSDSEGHLDDDNVDDVDDDEDSDEDGISLGSVAHDTVANNDYGDGAETNVDVDEDDDDDDDEFRKFDSNGKKTQTTVDTSTPPLSSTPVAKVHNGREHKRMNLPPLFSQNPEISSFWSSGGHLYKIRMSPMVQEPSAPGTTTLQNPNRLGRLNLFVPMLKTNRRDSRTPSFT